MRILHVADLHLGKAIFGRDLIPDQRTMLARLCDVATDEKPDVTLVAGDVFDRGIPSPEAVRLFGDFLFSLKNIDTSMIIVVIPGNHDSAARLGYCADLLRGSGVHIRIDPDRCDEPIVVTAKDETCRIWALPFLSPGAFGDSTVDTNDSPHHRTQAESFALAMSRIAAAKNTMAPATDVLLCHAFASGGAAGEMERRFLGTAEFIDPSAYAEFDYVALGHLHTAQPAGRNARYAGSPMAYSFGKADQEKSVSVVNVRRGGFDERRVPIRPPRPLLRIRGSFADLTAAQPDPETAESYIEAILTDPTPTIGPAEPLRRVYPFLLSVRQECMERAAPTGQLVESIDITRSMEDDFAAFYESATGSNPEAELSALFKKLTEEAAHETAQT